MTSRRRKHSAVFKAKVALQAVKEINTSSEMAAQYELHPTQITQWKKVLVDRSPELFEKGDGRKGDEEIESMKRRHFAKIGQLTLDIDFLKKKCKDLGIALDGEQ